MHAARIGVMKVAMAWQHPLKFVTQKFFHRTRLLGPRIPCNAPKRRQCLPVWRPRQVIAGEQKFVPVKKNNVTASMSRRWNHEQLLVELNGFGTVNYLLDAETAGTIISVHDSVATKSLAKQLVIGNVVFVREQHAADAAHHFDPFYELRREPWRVDQKIASFARGSSDQVTPGAEARFRSETAEVDIVVEVHRKRINADVSIVSLSCANRSSGTRDECHHCASDFILAFGLMIDAALIAVIAKDFGR